MVHHIENSNARLPKILGNWLNSNDLSVNAGAARLGVSWATLDRWMSAGSMPPRTRLPALAITLGIPVEQLAKLVARERSLRLVGKGHRRSRGSCAKPTKAVVAKVGR